MSQEKLEKLQNEVKNLEKTVAILDDRIKRLEENTKGQSLPAEEKKLSHLESVMAKAEEMYREAVRRREEAPGEFGG